MVKHQIDWYKLDNSQIKLDFLTLRHRYREICSNIRLDSSEANYFKKFEIKQQIEQLLAKYNSNLKHICSKPTLLTFENILKYDSTFFID